MELLKYKRCSVIDDSYNANPISMKNAFTFINKVNNKADIKYKIIAILGEMRELGENSDSIHKELGEWLKNTNTSCAYFYTIGRGAKILAESSGVPFSSFSSVEDAMSDTEVIQEIIEKEETLVLLKGSNSVGVTKFNQFLKNIK
jgi:UDP-N-acetylmuramoyl-tripeptide--D-alanyl-D-alanine ligase